MTSDPTPDYEDALAAMMAFVDEDESANGPIPLNKDRATDAPAAEWGGDQGQETPQEAEQDQPDLFFASVEEFVREYLAPMYRRKVSARGSRRWSAQWWRNPEAVARLEALWRAWENLRQDGGTGMSTWWRDHADYHMNALFDPDGPFASAGDENKVDQPLPCAPAPRGLFPDARPGGAE
ncbi:DUF4913 domain-containing protein [Nocardiopsis baichengensis]|uniref:DUF4913 domain-containing protein n=1 Tax=Nocardiopsis baichengensis TaxID=280240 RepID=UPI00034BEBF1|nr:DUF4913 domain-containing protein [Nocardiopsis baichengensis]